MEDVNQLTLKTVDVELNPHHVQALNNADAIGGFFARLGYDTHARTEQSPANLGITAERTVSPIKSIELIADHEHLFQVYLFELTSVTVSHTRALARTFRNRAGNYLLVLTSDYQRLDFVLIEKYVPEGVKVISTIGQRQVGVWPRPLTIDRRKPNRVHLRVLRRLTWTESDPFAQYDKLRSAYDVADWSEEFFNNRALFSDYYLKERLPMFDIWKEDPKPAYVRLRELYQSAAARFAGKEERFLRQELMEPVLHALGFEAKMGKKADSSAEEPDYRLCSANNKTDPMALCLVYPWGRSLDGKDDQRDKETPDENPGAVIVSLLEKGETPWVTVTNGKLWRLYAQRAHSRATNYYEIDLEEVLAQAGPYTADPAEAFRYFWLLFRCQALEPTEVTREGKEQYLPFLDRLLLESEDYAKKLGERLKERVFEHIFPHLASGFIASIGERDGLHAYLSQQALDAVFQGTLTFLYRLLFLLYAEARDLFPVKEERGYFAASVTQLKREIGEQAGSISDEVEEQLKKHYREDRYELYDGLSRLFQVVDKGDHALNVPVYNGGLFLSDPAGDDESPEAQAARFLSTTKAADRFLARVLDLLARDVDEKRHDLVFIDYKSLGVRQLGSIYEGLLEFKLRVAAEKMAVVKGKKTEEVILYTDAKREKRKILKYGRGKDARERVIAKGTVYLENDKHERKATGSYYTPDHIVKYIVEHAVGPVVREKFEAMRPKLRAAQKWHRDRVASAKAKNEPVSKYEYGPAVEHKWGSLVDELFGLKILDPAMGSGHFLVGAVDFITDKAIDFLNAFSWNPVIAHLTEMRETIRQEMDEQGVTIDAKRLTDVNLLKRHVLKRCTYGVDLNPMAVELAKVSLWLDCFTLGAPLSFLDHHLRCGNSLIGVTVEEAREAIQGKGIGTDPGDVRSQGLLFGSRFAGLLLATDLMRHVGELSDITSAQVQESRTEYRKASEALAPFKRILDVYTSQWFGNGIQKKARSKRKASADPPAVKLLKTPEAEAFISVRDDAALKKALDAMTPEDCQTAQTALAVAEEKRFFHWELEFPEVFYGPRPGTTQVIERLEGAGFDAVIGNPPYVNVLNISNIERDYILQTYTCALGRVDVYIPFMEQAFRLLRKGGTSGFITPNKYMVYGYGHLLRDLLLGHCLITRLIDLARCPSVFPEASTYTAITVFRKIPPCESSHIRCTVFEKDISELLGGAQQLDFSPDARVYHIPVSRFQSTPEHVISARLSDQNWNLLTKCRSTGFELGEKFKIEQCIRIGSKKVRGELILDEWGLRDLDASEREKARKVIDAEELAKYAVEWQGRYLLYEPSKLYNPKSSELLDNPKVLVKDTSTHLTVALDIGERSSNGMTYFYPLNTIYAIVPQDGTNCDVRYLAAILNCPLSDFLYKLLFGALTIGGGYVRFREYLQYLPVRRIAFTTPPEEKACLVEEGKRLYEHCMLEGDNNYVLRFVEEQLYKSPERADVVHDLLAFLTEDMIQAHGSLQAEVCRFLAWLERQTGSKVSVWKNKEKINSYHKYDCDTLLSILKLNHCEFRGSVNPESRSFQEIAKHEFQLSIERLRRLKVKLAATERVIEQIVYQLYELSDDEIQIVEAHKKESMWLDLPQG